MGIQDGPSPEKIVTWKLLIGFVLLGVVYAIAWSLVGAAEPVAKDPMKQVLDDGAPFGLKEFTPVIVDPHGVFGGKPACENWYGCDDFVNEVCKANNADVLWSHFAWSNSWNQYICAGVCTNGMQTFMRCGSRNKQNLAGVQDSPDPI